MKTTAPALASCALLICLLLQPPAGAEATVVSLTHSPLKPTPDDDVTVTLQLTNSSEVNRTYLAWCQSNPEVCFTPKEMRYIGDGVYTLAIGKYPDGMGIKYNCTILQKDGNMTVTETFNYTVHKASGGNGQNNTNNTNTTGNGKADDEQPTFIPFIAVAVVAVAVIAVIMIRRKKPGSQ